MKAFNISDSAYYRYRYLLGYGVYALVLGAMLSLAISDVPNGISRSEADSAVQSATMSLASLKEGHIIDAPYHLLQKLSLHYFGITTLGIRLPSVILGMVMGLLLALMLKRWFRTNVAVLTGILTATSVPFMTMGRVGTPMIMGAFWMVALLLGVTHTLHDGPRRFFWKLFSVTALALSLYTPLALYPLVALMTAGLLHPHVRYVIRKVSPLRKAIASVLVIGLLLPLAWAAIRHPANFAVLLGMNHALPSFQGLLDNVIALARGLFGSGTAPIGAVAAPAISYALAMLIIFGFVKTIRDRHSARSYMLLVWTISLIPLVLWHVENVIAYFIPCMLLLAIGLEALIDEWYSLFPRNPYARVAALVPLAVLLAGVSLAGITQYLRSQTYAAPIARQYSYELGPIRTELARSDRPVHIVADQTAVDFYGLLRRDFVRIGNVSTNLPPQSGIDTIVVAPHMPAEYAALTPNGVVTRGTIADGLVLSVYR